MASFMNSFKEIVSDNSFLSNTLFLSFAFLINRILYIQNNTTKEVFHIVNLLLFIYIVGYTFLTFKHTVQRNAYVLPGLDFVANIRAGVTFLSISFFYLIVTYLILSSIFVAKETSLNLQNYILAILILVLFFSISFTAIALYLKEKSWFAAYNSTLLSQFLPKYFYHSLFFILQLIFIDLLIIAPCKYLISMHLSSNELIYLVYSFCTIFSLSIMAHFYGNVTLDIMD